MKIFILIMFLILLIASICMGVSEILLSKIEIPSGMCPIPVLQRVGALSIPPGSSLSAAIDTERGFLYCGNTNTPPSINKINLSTFTVSSTLLLTAAEDDIYTGVVDAANGFGYFGMNSQGIVKVRLNPFTRIAKVASMFTKSSSAIDVLGGKVYFGTSAFPGNVVKVDLATFAIDQTLNFAPPEGSRSCVIDTVHGFIYLGLESSPANIIKVSLTNPMVVVGSLLLAVGENFAFSAVLDPVHNFAYFGTGDSPGKIVKVDLSTFTRVGSITCAAGYNSLISAIIDPVNGFAYFGTFTNPGRIIKVKLSTFSIVDTLILNGGEANLSGAQIDLSNQLSYWVCNTSPSIVVKVRLCQ